MNEINWDKFYDLVNQMVSYDSLVGTYRGYDFQIYKIDCDSFEVYRSNQIDSQNGVKSQRVVRQHALISELKRCFIGSFGNCKNVEEFESYKIPVDEFNKLLRCFQLKKNEKYQGKVRQYLLEKEKDRQEKKDRYL